MRRGPRDSHLPIARHAGQSGGTIAAWEMDDLEKTVDALTVNGVRFEHYDSDRIKTNEKEITEMGVDRMAWFKDSDGNIYGIAEN